MGKRLAVLAVGVWLTAGSVSAQTAADGLRKVLFRSLDGNQGALSENSFASLYGLLLGETTTFPTGSSAGGFTWTFDPDVHVPVRRSRSFGPMFAERPFTIGRRRLNVGAVVQHTTFSSVGGQPLTDLESSSSYRNGDEIYRYTSSLSVEIDRTIVSATYGLHERVDVAAIVPFGRSRVSGFSAFYQLYEGQETTSRAESSGASA